MVEINVFLAFGAGLLSFLSPCVLPLVPVYISYLTGSAVSGEKAPKRSTAFTHALFFGLGFSLVFVLLFGLPVGYLGHFLGGLTSILAKVGGIFLIVFGLHTAGLVKIPFLLMEKRMEVRLGDSPTCLRSLLVGMTFGAGWTPCVGPLLGAILTMALDAQSIWQAVFFLAVYSMGLGIPFLVVALVLATATKWLRRFNRHLGFVSVLSGLFLIAAGMVTVL